MPPCRAVGATVITAEEIRRAGVVDVNAAIRKIGGVYGRQSLDGSPDFGLDLRGFGTNSSQNLVILVDGVRLSKTNWPARCCRPSRSTPSSASRSRAAAAACCMAKARPAA
jgi:outer membrane receptor for ferrienterochelin and colicin